MEEQEYAQSDGFWTVLYVADLAFSFANNGNGVNYWIRNFPLSKSIFVFGLVRKLADSVNSKLHNLGNVVIDISIYHWNHLIGKWIDVRASKVG